MKTTDCYPNLTPAQRYELQCKSEGKQINQILFNLLIQ